MLRRLLSGMFAAGALIGLAELAGTGAVAAEPTGNNYDADRRFLAAHTQVLELTDGKHARVAICPDWQGRVMTSTCSGLSGESYGWINYGFIKEGQPAKDFNNYGGEDRFWISPEAGQFAFFFAPGVEQKVVNWVTPPGLDEGPFRMVSKPNEEFRFARKIHLQNASKTEFDLDVVRGFKLLQLPQFEKLFGAEAGSAVKAAQARLVGFATHSAVTNRGAALSRDTGLISIWSLGQFKPGPHTVIMIPFQAGNEQELGPPVTPDYFGPVPPERLKVTDNAVLFLGDGQFRAKLGISPKRTKAVAGSYNFDRNLLAIVSFSLPKDATNRMYINNRWEMPQAEPFRGDAFNSYNDGPVEPGGKPLGGFYELETMSPTLELASGETLTHEHRTFHFEGDVAGLAAIAKAVLGVDLAAVRTSMCP